MKNLADFKRNLQSAKENGILLKSELSNKQNEIVKINPFTTVGHIQSNAFALNRNNSLSWAEYGKASEWSFESNKAVRTFKDGGKITFEFSDNQFFN